MVTVYEGILPRSILSKLPSIPAPPDFTFGDWVANQVNLEQLLCVAGFLAPPFYEVNGCLFWDRKVARALASKLARKEEWKTRYGSDPETIERYYNLVALEEFFFGGSFDEAVLQEGDVVEEVDLVQPFGKVLEHFWGQELRARFPDRVYRFEIAEDMYDEDGLCLTFWQDRGSEHEADGS